MNYGWDDVSRLLIGGRDFIPFYVEELVLPEGAAVLDGFTPAGSIWRKVWDSGARKTKQMLKVKLPYDDTATSGPDVYIKALPQGGHLIASIRGTGIGKRMVCGRLATGTYERMTEQEKLHRLVGEFDVDGALEEGPCLHDQVAETGSTYNTDASSVDNGVQGSAITIATSSVANPTVITTSAPHLLETGDTVVIAGHTGSTPAVDGHRVVTVLTATTFTVAVNVTVGGTGGTVTRTSTRGGGTGYLSVPEQTNGGYTSSRHTQRHSADNVTFVTLGTFADITAALQDARITVTGSVNRYLSCSGSWIGAGSGQSVTPVHTFVRAA